MALNKDPVFANASLYATGIPTTANTNLDGTTGAYTTILTAGPDGAVVTSLTALARATVTATACRLFVSTDGGSTRQFIDEQVINAYTVANTTAQTPVTFINKLNPDDALWLPPNAILYATIAVTLAAGVVFAAEYRNLTA